jgi:glycosyltransferase involved in cell wall biosynthesis
VRILILNWRCPRNPKAGGAEIVTYEIARRLVARGQYIEWFASSVPGTSDEEDLDGIHIVRAGRQWSVHLAAFRRYKGRLRGSFDAVVDQVNTIPFFTPLWADIPSFMFIHQLAREVWWYESPFPINAIGYVAEPYYLRFYRKRPVLTVSTSTLNDLRELGFSGPITIVPEGLESAPQFSGQKADLFTFLYVGRMAPSKRIADIIRAFAFVRRTGKVAQLWLVGTGSTAYEFKLRALVTRLGLERDVHFFGRLSTEEKYRRMVEAHVLLMASVREGWGLVVLEANACGTPAVVYDAPGLRDAVRNEQTGLVCEPSAGKLSEAMLRLEADPGLYHRLASEARKWSTTFSYDKAAECFGDAIMGRVGDRESSRVTAGTTGAH